MVGEETPVPAVVSKKQANSNRPGALAGKRLLMVEDEFLVGMMVKKNLEGLGATVVGPYARLAEGIAAAKAGRLDGALLDFNLGGKLAEPLADLLIARGVPFVFITGYQRDSIDRRYANIPILQKPIEAATLEHVLTSLLDVPPQRLVAE
jgi:CheY-like chemotaxis protein